MSYAGEAQPIAEQVFAYINAKVAVGEVPQPGEIAEALEMDLALVVAILTTPSIADPMRRRR